MSLQRGDPKLNHSYLWHSSPWLFLFLSLFSLFSPCPCTSAAPSPSSRAKGNKGIFSPSLSVLLLKCILFFHLFFYSSCAAPSLCVIDFSFVCQACLSLALSRTLSPTALSPALSLFLDHCPPPLSFFPLMCMCSRLSFWESVYPYLLWRMYIQVLNILTLFVCEVVFPMLQDPLL